MIRQLGTQLRYACTIMAVGFFFGLGFFTAWLCVYEVCVFLCVR